MKHAQLLKLMSCVERDQVRFYDNGGKTLDRYTAVYLCWPEHRPNTFDARGMSEKPFSPQGFGCSCTATPGKHLGKRIKFADLPHDCQRLVLQDLTYLAEEE